MNMYVAKRYCDTHQRGIFGIVVLIVSMSCGPAVVIAGDGQGALPAPTALEARCGLPFRDNAVLQQNLPLPVWGTSLPGASVSITFNGQTRKTKADNEGRWRVTLDPMKAIKLASVHQIPDGLTMTVVCEKDGEKAVKEIRNLVMGEVWLCAGQSNMAGAMRGGSPQPLPDAPDEAPDYPGLRQMVSPQDQPWVICSPDTLSPFKRVGFYFSRSVYRGILVPVGTINASVGGSKIETWLNQPPYGLGGNYTNMIVPLAGYGIRGVVWYQGESNAGDGREYFPKLKSLIQGWREVWNQPDAADRGGPHANFPVYFVQLPGLGTSTHDDPAGGDGRAEIRQAQCEALALENTGMAITIDIGAVKEHPPNKYDTGIRLARLALHNEYGFGKLTPCGPLYKAHRIEGGAIRIIFDHAESGLMFAIKQGTEPPRQTPGEELDWLAIQDKDGTWHWADGVIQGSELVVSSPQAPSPVAVRYAYTIHPTGPLLYNKEGLPASPFTTCGYDAEKKAAR